MNEIPHPEFEKSEEYETFTTTNGLEEAARLYAIPHYMKDIDLSHIEEYPYDTGLEAAFIAGAKWQADHTPLPEDTVLFNKGVAEGKRLMMEEAVEKTVFQITRERTPVIMLTLDANEYKDGDKVHVIVIPNTDEK